MLKLINLLLTQKQKILISNYVGFSITQGNEYRKKSWSIFKFTALANKITSKNKTPVFFIEKDKIDLVLKYFSKELLNQNIKWITYLSATSVYGDHKGEWVDEKSETLPKSKSGIERLAVENGWLKMYEEHKIPLQIFRLSGIYSNKNNVLERIKSGNGSIIRKKNQFFSRVHVEDIANLLFISLNKFKKGEVYNVSDDKPASSEDVMQYGAKILNLPEPKEIKLDQIESEMLKAFYNDSKKVSNKKAKEFFKYNFKFPTYIEGLNYINKKLLK